MLTFVFATPRLDSTKAEKLLSPPPIPVIKEYDARKSVPISSQEARALVT